MPISASVLGMTEHLSTSYLDWDASHEVLGAVLPENQNGAEGVITYASRVLAKPERNYNVTASPIDSSSSGFVSGMGQRCAPDRMAPSVRALPRMRSRTGRCQTPAVLLCRWWLSVPWCVQERYCLAL